MNFITLEVVDRSPSRYGFPFIGMDPNNRAHADRLISGAEEQLERLLVDRYGAGALERLADGRYRWNTENQS